MTKSQVNKIIKKAAKAHGFKTSEEPGFHGFTEIISSELNFIFQTELTENTDWEANRIEESLTITASVCRMGGSPSAEELIRTANEIRRGAELVKEIQEMNLILIETF